MKPLAAAVAAVLAFSIGACSNQAPDEPPVPAAAVDTQPAAPVEERTLPPAEIEPEAVLQSTAPSSGGMLPDPAVDSIDDERARQDHHRDAKQATEEAARRFMNAAQRLRDAGREAVSAVRESRSDTERTPAEAEQ